MGKNNKSISKGNNTNQAINHTKSEQNSIPLLQNTSPIKSKQDIDVIAKVDNIYIEKENTINKESVGQKCSEINNKEYIIKEDNINMLEKNKNSAIKNNKRDISIVKKEPIID